LKFDMKLVQRIETASLERQKMLANLVHMVLELGIKPLAEGIETPGEDAICRRIGFTSAQGFYYGVPALPKKLLEEQTAAIGNAAGGEDSTTRAPW
jgi:EAL domain-containing protein (putative c-di-GMP-specific phosphodiesterase class I)